MQYSDLFSPLCASNNVSSNVYRHVKWPTKYHLNNWLSQVRAAESGFAKKWRNHDAEHHWVCVDHTSRFSNSNFSNGSRHARESAAGTTSSAGL